MIKLNIGCGWRNFGKDWHHVDGGEYDHLDSNDIFNLPYEDNSVDLIYASHIIEYFDRKEIIPILNKWKNKYTHIFVDEFQDTNKPQFQLVTKLAEKNICVVGDDNQAIYGWRGSDITYIIEFEKYFENSKTFLLETNYRSTPTILNAASDIIDLNTIKTNKSINPFRKNNKHKINIIEGSDEYERLKRTTALDFFMFGLANIYSYSLC